MLSNVVVRYYVRTLGVAHRIQVYIGLLCFCHHAMFVLDKSDLVFVMGVLFSVSWSNFVDFPVSFPRGFLFLRLRLACFLCACLVAGLPACVPSRLSVPPSVYRSGFLFVNLDPL